MQNLEKENLSFVSSAAASFLTDDEINNLSSLISKIEKIYVCRALKINPEQDDISAAEKLVRIAIPLESEMFYLEDVDSYDLMRAYSVIALIFEYAAKIEQNKSSSILFWLRASLAYMQAKKSANSIICAQKARHIYENETSLDLDDITKITMRFLSREVLFCKDEAEKLLEKEKKLLEKEINSLEEQSKIFGSIEIFQSIIHISDYLINGTESNWKEHMQLALSHFKKSNDEMLIWLISRLIPAMNDLASNSLWNMSDYIHQEIIRAFTNHPINPIYELWDNQIKAIEKLSGKNSKRHNTLVMPTSAGKTLVAAISIAQELFKNNGRCFYVTPYRALVTEVSEFLNRYLPALGIKVSYLPGKYDAIPYLEDLLSNDGRVFVLTPEKLDLLWRTNDKRLKETQVFVFDEVQNITEEGRGLRLELLISRIKQNFGIYSRIFLLSAVIPQDILSNFTDWIGAKTSDATSIQEKPTRTLGAYYYRAEEVDGSGNLAYWKRFNIKNILPFTDNWTRRGDASELAIKYSKHLGPVLVYCSKRDDAERTAELIHQNISPSDDNSLEIEAKIVQSIMGNTSILPEMLKNKIAFHHAALPDPVKKLIEKLGREGKLRIICSTSTLVEGVNLNVGTVIISSSMSGHIFMNGLKIKNLAGRAGRALKDTEGHVITMNDAVRLALTDDAYTVFKSRFFRYLSGLNDPSLDADVDALESELLSRFYREELSQTNLNEDASKILRTTLFSRQANSLEYSAILSGVQESAKKILDTTDLHGIHLQVFAETGLGIKHCQTLDANAKQLCQEQLKFRNSGKLNWSDINKIISASILPSSRFGSKLQNKISDPIPIINAWIEGKSILEISSLIEDNPSTKTISYVTQFLYGYVSDEMSWSSASLLKLIDSNISKTPILNLDYEWYLLPSYLKYGVNNPASLLLSLGNFDNREYVAFITREFDNTQKIDWITILCWILSLKDTQLKYAQKNLLLSLSSFSIPTEISNGINGKCTVYLDGTIIQNDAQVGKVPEKFLPIIQILEMKKCSTYILKDNTTTVLQINPD